MKNYKIVKNSNGFNLITSPDGDYRWYCGDLALLMSYECAVSLLHELDISGIAHIEVA